MRHAPTVLTALALALVTVALRAHAGAPQGPGAWALFSFAVSAFRGPVR